MGKLELVMALGLSVSLSMADVGDFAPLEVGNKWVYSGHSEWWDDVGSAGSFDVKRVVELTTRNQVADTTVFEVRLTDFITEYFRNGTDSITGKWAILPRPDTTASFNGILKQYPDSSLNFEHSGKRSDYMLGFLFRTHTFPEDSVINGSKVLVKFGQNGDGATYLKNIGLVDFEDIYNSPFGGWESNFHISEFNGAVVSTKGRRPSPSRQIRSPNPLHFKTDLLGRRVKLLSGAPLVQR